MFTTRALFAKVVKRSTGLVGLDAVPEARKVLVQLYEKTLRDVQVRVGRDSAAASSAAGSARSAAWRGGWRGNGTLWRAVRGVALCCRTLCCTQPAHMHVGRSVDGLLHCADHAGARVLPPSS